MTFNPLLTFILPGIVIFLLVLTGRGVSLVNTTTFSDFVLGIHGDFVLGFFGNLGLQLVIFGLAVHTAGKAYGLRGLANRIFLSP